MKKISLYICIISLVLFWMCPITVKAASVNEIVAVNEINGKAFARADILRWYYKTINGKRYKRLFNASKNKWVGDWIPV